MNRLKVILLTVIVVASTFLCMESVKAEGDGTGYAQCYYFYDERRAQSYENISYEIWRPYIIGINFYKDENGAYKSWADVGCGDTSSAQSILKTESNICHITNYNDIFHNASTFSAYFKNSRNNSWGCPTRLGITKSGNDGLRVSIGTIADSCINNNTCMEWSLYNNYSKTTGTPTELNVIGVESKHKNSVTNNTTGETISGENADSDIDAIINWAENYESLTEAEYENLCNVITPETKSFIRNIVIVISVAGILIFLIITMIEFLKGLVSSDDDRISKLLKKLKTRVIFVVLLLLLPIIVTGLINLVNDVSDGMLGEQDPLCDIMEEQIEN